MTSIIPSVGLAAGAVLAGALVQFAPEPRVLVFVLLAIVFVLTMVVMAAGRETAPRRPGGWASLAPRIRVGRDIRGAFTAHLPGLAAPWAQVGFALSLTTTLAADRFGITDRFTDGLVVAAVCGFAFVGTWLTRTMAVPRATVAGSAGLIAGSALTLASLAGPWDVPFYLGSALTGVGVGITLGAVMRALSGLPAPADRAEFFAAVYVVGYLAFSVPAVIAGVFVVHAGLVTTTVGYGIGVCVLALAAAANAARTARRAAGGAVPAPEPAAASRG